MKKQNTDKAKPQNTLRVLGTVKAKLFILAIMAIVATFTVGNVGKFMLKKNNKSADALTEMNNITLLQYENKAYNAEYQYNLDTENLKSISTNLDAMQEYASQLQKSASVRKSEVEDIKSAISNLKDNYEQIISLAQERGFKNEEGEYASYIKDDSELQNTFSDLSNNSSWVDASWADVYGPTATVQTIDGKPYIKYSYSSEIKPDGNRDYLVLRFAGNELQYTGTAFFNNITLGGSATTSGDASAKGEKFDISKITTEQLQSKSYGDALDECKMTTFLKQPSVEVKGKFDNSDEQTAWHETNLVLPLENINAQDYTRVSFDAYISLDGQNREQLFKIAAAYNEIYDFGEAFGRLSSKMSTYNKHVIEGEDTSSEANEIQALIKEMTDNLATYAPKYASYDELKSALDNKNKIFSSMQQKDQNIYDLKQENITQENNLTSLIDESRNQVEATMRSDQSTTERVVMIVLIISILVIAAISYAISIGITRSLRNFKNILTAMSEGNLGVRAATKGHGEFSQFGVYLNQFLDKISSVLKSVQDVAGVLMVSGDELEQSAQKINTSSEGIGTAIHDISEGAASQSDDVVEATKHVSSMTDIMKGIVENVEELKKTSVMMNTASQESVEVLVDLTNSNDKMTAGVERISNQIHKTNVSVDKIKDAVQLISAIAEQTNLLSLNASIEAARAGEAGKGFAVVATEIQKLAEQSNMSAQTIDDVITTLLTEFEITTKVMEEVEHIAGEQLKKLEQTQSGFEKVNEGVINTQSSTGNIDRSTEKCYTSCSNMGSIMNNLSAISEENTASAVETSEAMQELNNTITALVESAKQLKDISAKLDDDMQFFSFGEDK